MSNRVSRCRRRWRHYETASGKRPVRDFLMKLPDVDRAAVAVEMQDVRNVGLRAGRHLRGDLYEVRAAGYGVVYRVIFAAEGRFSQVLLSLHAIKKKTQKTPPEAIELAERRLRDWRSRGRKA